MQRSVNVTVMLKGMFFDSWAIIQQNRKACHQESLVQDIVHCL